MSAMTTAYASAANSALDCRTEIDRLAGLWARLSTATSEEISQSMRVLENIPSAPNPGDHAGPVGSAMLAICEQTKLVRQKLSTHVLELEFLGCEAATVAAGVRPLADFIPLLAALPAPTLAPAHAPNRPAPLQVQDDPEADQGAAIAEIKGDLDAGRVTPWEPVAPEVRQQRLSKEILDAAKSADAIQTERNLAALRRVAPGLPALPGEEGRNGRHGSGLGDAEELPAFRAEAEDFLRPAGLESEEKAREEVQARAGLESLRRLEEAEFDQLPAAVWARTPPAHLVQDIGPDDAKQAVQDVANAIAAAEPATLPTAPPAKKPRTPRKPRK